MTKAKTAVVNAGNGNEHDNGNNNSRNANTNTNAWTTSCIQVGYSVIYILYILLLFLESQNEYHSMFISSYQKNEKELQPTHIIYLSCCLLLSATNVIGWDDNSIVWRWTLGDYIVDRQLINWGVRLAAIEYTPDSHKVSHEWTANTRLTHPAIECRDM